MTDRHEAGKKTRPAALGDSHVDRAEITSKGLVASPREIGRRLAGLAEAAHPDMNIKGVFSPESQLGNATAEARAFACSVAQGRGRQ